MSTERNKAVVRRLFEALVAGDEAAIADLRAPNRVGLHAPGGRLVGPGDAAANRGDGLAYREAFPDWSCTIDHLVAEGDYVVARWTNSGTHLGTFRNARGSWPPTRRRVTWSGVNVYRFENGKIAENWLHFDELHFYAQLGGG